MTFVIGATMYEFQIGRIVFAILKPDYFYKGNAVLRFGVGGYNHCVGIL